MAVSAQDVKKLREMTGAGMMDCKKALESAGGNFDQAVDELRKKGQKISEKRADAEAVEGGIFVALTEDQTRGALIELNCETDFVARNEDFQQLGQRIADETLAQQPADLAGLQSMPIDGKPVQDHLKDAMGKIGEKIEVSKYETLSADRVTSYIHIGGRVGVLVGFNGKPGTDLSETGKDIAMQVAAMNPLALEESGLPGELIERERAIAMDQLAQDPKQANKPDDIKAKIVEGKLKKFYKEKALLSQEFVKDSQFTVAGYLKQQAPGLSIAGYKRLHLGN